MNYLLVLIPFLALIIFNLLSRRIREAFAFWVVLAILLGQGVSAALFSHIFPAVLLLSAALVMATALLIARSTIKEEADRFNFMNLMLIGLIGINSLSFITDLFTLYIFIEVIAISTFILINLLNQKDAYEGAFKYLVLSMVASIMMLSSIALFLIGPTFAQFALILFLCGLFIKSGLVPFHGWLPDAYQAAPAPVSILLAGIITKASGVFALARILQMVGMNAQISSLLLMIGALSVVIGALAALTQTDIKRMLAYSSISQVGYIILGFGVGNQLGFMAALFHFFNHAVFKSQLFANAAAIEAQTGVRNIDGMRGLAQKMPVTGVTTLIASLSTAGIPPLSGFWSKLLIVIALWTAGFQAYAWLAILASVITLGYMLRWQREMFFGEPGPEKVSEADRLMLIPVVVLSSITVVVGLIFPLVSGHVMRF